MDQEYNNILEEQMQKLPPEVQKAILSPELEKNLQEIGAKNRLHIDQIGRLKDEAVLVMMGLEEPDNFYNNLVDQVHLDKEVAEKSKKM